MSTFNYKAKKKNAETVSGEIIALNKDQAVEEINQMGLVPVTVTEVNEGRDAVREFFYRRVTIKDLYHFSRQLAGLLKAGITLIRALQILQDQVSNTYFRHVIAQLCLGIKDGKSFADCLSAHPHVFVPLYVAMVRVGEESGNLREMLLSLAQYYQSQAEIASKVRAALVYPIIMMILGVATIFFMLTFVIPQISTLLLNTHQALPWPTAVLLSASAVIQGSWAGILIFGAVISVLLGRWFKSKAGHRSWGQFELTVPFFSSFVLRVELARFCRTLELLLKSGVIILKALRLSLPLVNNDLIREQLTKCHDDLVAGNSLGQSIKKSTVIPPILGDLIAVGEESGSLVDTLHDVADSYEQETDETVKIMTTLLEPLMIIIIGSVVGFIVFALLLPIFQMDVFR